MAPIVLARTSGYISPHWSRTQVFTGICGIHFIVIQINTLINLGQTHQEHLQLPQGWDIFLLIFPAPAWWGICHFLQALKTNPHLYPRVEGGRGEGFILTGA